MKYKRILLKLSGEALAGKEKYGICVNTVNTFCLEIKSLVDIGVEVALVIGGGNIHRGVAEMKRGLGRTTSDYMGMLATIINALALQNGLERGLGLHTRVLTAIDMKEVAEPYIRRRAVRHLEKKRIVIFAGGTGNPYFTTDTAAALRANEIDAPVIFKATKVDGVYNKDPKKYKDAVRFDKLNYIDVLNKDLKAMDATAITLCMENNIEIIVFNALKKGNIKKVVTGEHIGTIIEKKGRRSKV